MASFMEKVRAAQQTRQANERAEEAERERAHNKYVKEVGDAVAKSLEAKVDLLEKQDTICADDMVIAESAVRSVLDHVRHKLLLRSATELSAEEVDVDSDGSIYRITFEPDKDFIRASEKWQ